MLGTFFSVCCRSGRMGKQNARSTVLPKTPHAGHSSRCAEEVIQYEHLRRASDDACVVYREGFSVSCHINEWRFVVSRITVGSIKYAGLLAFLFRVSGLARPKSCEPSISVLHFARR